MYIRWSEPQLPRLEEDLISNMLTNMCNCT